MERPTKKATRLREAVRKNFGQPKDERSHPAIAGKTSRERASASALRTAVEDAVRIGNELATELAEMVRLHELSTRLFASTALQPLLEEILDATMALLNADFGNVQLYNPETKALKIVAHRGFQREFIDYFNNVHEGTASCRTALKRGKRVIVEDVLTEPSFASYLEIVAAAGYRAVQSTPLFSRSGEPLGMISTHFRKPHCPPQRKLRFVDLYARQAAEMIERKRAEQTLRESEQKFSVVFDKASFAIVLAKLPNETIVDVNPAFVEMFGFTKEEALGRTGVELGINRDRKGHPHLIGDVVDRGYVRNLEATFFNKSGNPRMIACNMEVVSLRGENYILSMMRDVTEHKKAEADLRRSEAYLAEGQRLSQTASWALNVSTGEIFWSQELFRIYGLDPKKVKPGYPDVLNYIHPDDRAGVQKTFEEAMREQGEYEFAHRVVRTDGTIRHVNIIAHPVFDRGGTLVEYVGTTIDATERKDAEQKLHQTQAELAHVTRLTTLGEIGASIAHEINQPLGAIVNNSNVCLKLIGRRGSEQKKREILVDIANEAIRASAIITRIRALTKRSTSEKISFPVGDLVDEVLALAHQTVRKTSVSIKNLVPARLHLRADRVQLQQMLLNLVMNGIQAMSAVDEKNRTMTLQAKRQKLDGKPMITISVEDCGPGFTPEAARRLFEPFFTTKSDGMGLGLAISRSIAEAHGGRLWAEPNTCPGATFYCALPDYESKKSRAAKGAKSLR